MRTELKKLHDLIEALEVAAVLLEGRQPTPLYKPAKGWIGGEEPDVAEMHTLSEPH